MTKGSIAELAATASVALLIGLLSVRTIGYGGEQCSGGESVSQLTLKDKGFSTFPDRDPQFELRRDTFASDKGQFPNRDLGGAPVGALEGRA